MWRAGRRRLSTACVRVGQGAEKGFADGCAGWSRWMTIDPEGKTVKTQVGPRMSDLEEKAGAPVEGRGAAQIATRHTEGDAC